MKKYIKWGVLALVVVIAVSFFVGSYNSLVSKSAEVENSWSNVESQYQRRVDLIPNLVSTVKGYATHEQQTIVDAIEARAKSMSPTINIDELNDETLGKFQAAQAQLSQGIGRLMAIGESYPDLKASQNFMNLQDELAGTENRITKARYDFNAMVKSYNVTVKKFPRNLIAGMFGFEAKSYFAADAGADKAPTVEF